MLDIEEFAKTGELFDGRYRLLGTLSTEGGSADVWLAIDENTVNASAEEGLDGEDGEEGGIQVAIKIYRPKNALDIEGEQKFREEYKIVYNCHHANLLQPTNFSIFREMPYLVLPYCRKGSSEQMVGKEIDTRELWKYIRDVASGLACLHNNTPPIIHQDIKPANVLIDERDNYVITDFGISMQSGGGYGHYGDDNSGTFAYMAPERFSDNPEPLAASDIWAFGATLYELITGRAPFGDDGGQVQPAGAVRLDYPDGIPQQVRKLIAACLDMDPGRRPSAEDIEEAARRHSSPGSKPFLLKAAMPLAIAAVVAVALLSVRPVRIEPPVPVQVSPEEVFDANIHLLESNNADSLRRGLDIMDSLAKIDYLPAMYELLVTYGWFSNETSLKRKELLDIEVYNKGRNRYMPKSSADNDRAKGYIKDIERSADTLRYPDKVAKAKYCMAAYLLTEEKYSRSDVNDNQAKSLLEQSATYAERSGDTALLNTIKGQLRQF